MFGLTFLFTFFFIYFYFFLKMLSVPRAIVKYFVIDPNKLYSCRDFCIVGMLESEQQLFQMIFIFFFFK